MLTLLKWVAVLVAAGFTWLVGGYAAEYFRPYKK